MPPQSVLLNMRQAQEGESSSNHSFMVLERSLHRAIEQDHLHKVAHLVTLGACVNNYKDGMTPLARALQYNRKDVALYLVRECRPDLFADLIYYKDPPGCKKAFSEVKQGCDHTVPLLSLAVRGNQAEIVRELLDRGVDPNSAEVPSQRCAIHLAAQFNLVHIAQILIDFEANVNKFDIDGNTPLHSAVSSGNRKLTQLLLGAGASTNVPGKNGILPLSSAVQQADIGIVEDLLDYGSLVHVHNARGQTALHRAVLKDSIDLVEALLSRGASGNSQDIEGDTPLSLACEMRRADLVKVILKSDNSKKTHLSGSCVGTKVPLHIAAARGYTEIIDVMLKHGALVNQKDTMYRYTALLWAVRQCQTHAVLRLLQNGTNPNIAESVHGLTPLHLACIRDFNGSHLEIVKLLVNYGADINNPATNSQRSVLHIVSQKAAMDTFDYLLQRQDILLNQQDASGDTPLILTIKEGHEDLAKKLIEAGCDISSPCSGNETPFNCCIQNGRYKLGLIFIHHGCGVRVQDNFGGTHVVEMVHQAMKAEMEPDENEAFLSLIESILFLGAGIGSITDKNSPVSLLLKRKESDQMMGAVLAAACEPLSLLQICVVKIRDHLNSQSRGTSTASKMLNLPLPNLVKQQITQNYVSTTVE